MTPTLARAVVLCDADVLYTSLLRDLRIQESATNRFDLIRRSVYFQRLSVYTKDMTQIKVLLPELLARRRVNRRQLSELTGLRYATLSGVYHGQSRPSLETLELVMQGLERLTGQPVELSELLEVVHLPKPADAARPAFDHTVLKPFTLRSRGPAPQALVPTETLVAQIRGRD